MDDVVNLEMAKYCEERVEDGVGGYEKRFRLDVVIDSSGKALDVISQLCTSFRGVVLYAGGKIKIKIDKAEDPVQLFGMGNIITGSYSETWKSKRDSYNIVEVRYTDATKGYIDESIVIMDQTAIAAGEPQRKKSVRIFTTKLSYAIREGNFILRACRNLDRAISFKANISAIACMAFDVISFSHDVPQIGFSGLVKSGSSASSVVLDREVTIESGKTYHLLVYFGGDDSYEERIVTNVAGSASTITVSVSFGIEPSKFDKYSFGEVGKLKKDYRLASIRREPNYEVSLQAVEYRSALYTEGDLILPVDKFSALDMAPPPITNLRLTESLVKLKDGTIENVIDVWFSKPSLVGYHVGTYAKARIYLSDDDGESWNYKGETAGTYFQAIGNIMDLHEYKIAVVSVSSSGFEGSLTSAPFSAISVIGKSAPPSDVETFIVNQNKDLLTFGWTMVADVDVLGYEIRLGADWLSAKLVAFVQGDTYLTSDLVIGVSQSYWLKAVDTSGNYSANAKEAIITIASIPYKNIIEEYSEQATWDGDKSGHSDSVCRVTVRPIVRGDFRSRTIVRKVTNNSLVSQVTVV